MTYITGDIHGSPNKILSFCRSHELTANDTLIILGDVAANYFADNRDEQLKAALDSLGITILCIHGNHEQRPENIPGYSLTEWHGGAVWVQPKYPHLLFAKDGEIFDIDGMRFLVIGGAYSVDKNYRIIRGYGWWPDEQPSEEVKARVEQAIISHEFDAVLSHTCPYKYEPREMFLSGIDQSSVDDSTERWLDSIEERVSYKAWYCGHWHTDKRIDKMHFLFNSFDSLAQIDDK